MIGYHDSFPISGVKNDLFPHSIPRNQHAILRRIDNPYAARALDARDTIRAPGFIRRQRRLILIFELFPQRTFERRSVSHSSAHVHQTIAAARHILGTDHHVPARQTCLHAGLFHARLQIALIRTDQSHNITLQFIHHSMYRLAAQCLRPAFHLCYN